MGVFDWLFGGDDPDVVTTTNTTEVQIPQYLEDAHRMVIDESARLASQPYQAYPFPRIEPFSQDQQSAFDLARGGIGSISGLALDQYDFTRDAGGPVDPSQIDRYMNPFLSSVGQQTERELSRRHEQGLIDIGTDAVSAGSFGGARHGIIEAEANRNFDRNIGDMYERVFASGFDKSLAGLQGDKARQLQAGIGLSPAVSEFGQGLGFDINSMLGIGGMEQQLGQQSLNTAYQDFLGQRNYPYEELGFLSNVIQGSPIQQTETVTGQQLVNNPGIISPLIGGIATLGGASSDSVLGGFLENLF